MKGNGAATQQGIQDLFLREELEGDRLVNYIRFGALFLLMFLAFLKQGLFTGLHVSRSLTFTVPMIGVGFVYTVSLFFLYRKGIYHPSFKYFSVTLDITLVVLSIYSYKLDPYPEYAYIFFLARFSLIFWFIIWSLLRYSVRLSVYGGLLAGVEYLVLVVFNNVMVGTKFTFSGPDGILYSSEFARSEAILKVVYLALGGVVAGFVAWRLRDLVIRSVSHEQEKNELSVKNRLVEAVNDENRKYLDAIMEGLLLVDESFRVSDQYSRFLTTLFQRDDIAGQNLVDFLFPDLLLHATERRDLEKYLNILFTNVNADAETLRDVNPFAEKSFRIQGRMGEARERILGITFHRILRQEKVENVMVIFEDRTDILAAQENLEKERRLHESEVETISAILRTGPRTLREFIEESRSTLLDTKTSLPSLSEEEIMNRCFRGMHSLKGSAASLGFTRIGEQAHAVEEVLSRVRDQKSAVTPEVKRDLESGIQEIFSGFDLVQRLTKGFLQFSQMEQPSDTESAMARQEEFLESMRTMVVDLGRQLGKKVTLKVNNSLREMPFLGKMKNPLIHLVRNAVDHGIEGDVYQRLTDGKLEEGTVSLRMFVQDYHYVIEVSDDGGGLDFDRIRKKAAERNLLPSGVEEISQSRLLGVLFSPGFSTLDTATEVSGRGVGLDIVRDAVRGLKGTIAVSTRKARGTRFTLKIPQARVPGTV